MKASITRGRFHHFKRKLQESSLFHGSKSRPPPFRSHIKEIIFQFPPQPLLYLCILNFTKDVCHVRV